MIKYIIVTQKSTNTLISIMERDLNLNLHTLLAPKTKKRIVDRFKELKTKGWVNLSKDEKAEYKKLKDA